MSRRLALVILRLATLVALAVSATLLVDYLRPAAAFCAGGSGCEKVKSAIGGSVALPVLGVAGFGSLLFASLGGARARRFLEVAAIGGGLVALALLAAQALVIGAMCKLCVAVDASALVVAACAIALRGDRDVAAEERGMTAAWLGAGLFAAALPVAWSLVQPAAPVPAAVASLWAPGKINVVEMSDFQCPFCREEHPRLKAALAPYGDRIHLVRLNMPLASHAHAKDAARAYVCADDQGRGEPMADELFAAKDLSPEGARAIAQQLGLDLRAYDACVASGATERRIERESARVKEAGFKGLPTLWIGDRMLLGARSEEELREAVAQAAGVPSGPAVPPGYMWGALAIGIAAFAGVAVRRARRADGGAPA